LLCSQLCRVDLDDQSLDLLNDRTCSIAPLHDINSGSNVLDVWGNDEQKKYKVTISCMTRTELTCSRS
jgi:hypothetical protein